MWRAASSTGISLAHSLRLRKLAQELGSSADRPRLSPQHNAPFLSRETELLAYGDGAVGKTDFLPVRKGQDQFIKRHDAHLRAVSGCALTPL